jgi:type II secretory pathway predicted ATPase ExeA
MIRAGFERLHQMLVGPPRLEDDPTYARLRSEIRRRQMAHMSTRGLQQALTDYVHTLLRRTA